MTHIEERFKQRLNIDLDPKLNTFIFESIETGKAKFVSNLFDKRKKYLLRLNKKWAIIIIKGDTIITAWKLKKSQISGYLNAKRVL